MRTKIFKDNKPINEKEYQFSIEFGKDSETYIAEVKKSIDKGDEQEVGTINAKVSECKLVRYTRLTENDLADDMCEKLVANTEFPVLEIDGVLKIDSDGYCRCVLEQNTPLYNIDTDIIDYTLNRIEEAISDKLFEDSSEIKCIGEIYTDISNDNVSESVLETFESNGYDIVYNDEDDRVYICKCLMYSTKHEEDHTELRFPTEQEIIAKLDGSYKQTLKIFVSQPMSGLTNQEIIAARSKARADLTKFFKGEYIIEIIDNEQFDRPADWKHTDYMSYDIKCMGDAYFVYFLKGWETHRGCRIEYTVAEEYGFNILYEEHILERLEERYGEY